MDRSSVDGGWKDEAPFVAHESLVAASRARLAAGGGLFQGARVALLLEARRRVVYSRLVRAGGGEVLEGWGLAALLENQPGPEELTLVVLDMELLCASHPQHHRFLEWIELCRQVGGAGISSAT